ncbi:MAG: cell division protein FtsI/penicillin-binding protein 2, partial [Chlamydiales bacterium]
MPSKRKTASRDLSLSIPAKANKILNMVLLVMIFIIIRCWHLSVVQYEERLAGSRRPQRRVVIERAERGTIRDRFNLPLAVNKVQFNAAIFYSHIREIPSIAWEKNSEGERVKIRKRSEHITELSQLLSAELSMDPERIEDLIHSKASLFPNTAFVIKEDISEKEYFRLKILEKDWLGLYGERVPKRYY